MDNGKKSASQRRAEWSKTPEGRASYERVAEEMRKQIKDGEELEKEAVSYCFDNGLNLSPRVATDFARHFAQWGTDHAPLPEDTVLFNKGVAEGRRLESDENKDRDIVFWRGIQYAREQMLNEARNHFVISVLSGNDMKKMIEIYNDEADCKPGDVVRVIIFKKEGEK